VVLLLAALHLLTELNEKPPPSDQTCFDNQLYRYLKHTPGQRSKLVIRRKPFLPSPRKLVARCMCMGIALTRLDNCANSI
jgi:hypothetical protein